MSSTRTTRRRSCCSPAGPASRSRTHAPTTASATAATSWSASCGRWRPRRRSRGRSAARRTSAAILELIVKRARALVDARGVLILLRDGDELVVDGDRRAAGGRGAASTHAGRGLDQRACDADAATGADRLTCPTELRFAIARQITAGSGLFVPLMFRGAPSACSTSSTVRADSRTSRRGRAAAGRVRGERRDRRRDRADGCQRGPASQRSRRPSASASAGRWSCTTRRCRSSRASRCLLTRRARQQGRRDGRRDARRRDRADRHRDHRTAAADHRPASRPRSTRSASRPRWRAWPSGSRPPPDSRSRCWWILTMSPGARRNGLPQRWRARCTGSCRRRSRTPSSMRTRRPSRCR